jgi:hypothetical protein
LFYRWLSQDKDGIVEKYTRAREIQVEKFTDDIVPLADKMAGCIDPAQVQAARLQIDARKWVASKRLPRKYGDRLEHVGAGGKDLIPHEADPQLVQQAVLLMLEARAPLLPRARVRIEDSSGDSETE